MANPVYIQSKQARTNNSTTGPCAFTSPNTAHNCLVIFTFSQGAAISSIADSLGNKYYDPLVKSTLIGGYSANSIAYRAWVCRDCLPGANTVTVTFSGTSTANDVTVVEYSGIPISSDAGVMLTGTTGGGTAVSGTQLTTQIPNLFAVAYIKSASATTATGIWTQRTDFFPTTGISIQDAILPTANSYTVGATFTSTTWACLTLAFMSASSSGTLNLGTKGEVLYDGNVATPIYFETVAGNASLLSAWDKTHWTGWFTTVSNNAWVGVDCGVPVQLTRIRLDSRANYEDSLIGSYIQCSNTATFPNVDLTSVLQVLTRPNSGTFNNEFTVNLGGAAFRYYRFLMLPNRGGRLGDLAFIGSYATGTTAQAVTPVANPPGGHFDFPTLVTLSSLTTDAQIRYTLDGSTPTSVSTLYSNPILLSTSGILNAIAISPNVVDSDVVTYNFYVQGEWDTDDLQFDSNRNYPLWAVLPSFFYDSPSGYWYLTGHNFDSADGPIYSLPYNSYRSKDFKNWEWQGVISGFDRAAGTLDGRNFRQYVPKILYNALNDNYVAWSGDFSPVINIRSYVSASPNGPFVAANTYTSWNGADFTVQSDSTIFLDDNGDAYLLKGVSNTSLMVIKLSADYQSLTNTFTWYTTGAIVGGEAWTMANFNGNYFLQYSGQASWGSSLCNYVVGVGTPMPASWGTAKNPFQPFPGGVPSNTNSFDTQCWQIVKIPGRTNSYLYVGARFNLVGNDFSAHRIIILPVTFPTSTTMSISWLPTWNLDTVFPTTSGAPQFPSNLVVTGTTATWVNHEPKAHNLYLDTAPNSAFSSGVKSDVLPVGASTAQIKAPQTFYRIRAVNSSGTSSSNIASAGIAKLPLLYPTGLDSDANLGPTTGIIPGGTFLGAQGAGQNTQLTITRNLISQISAVQTKVGIDQSAIPAALDYRVNKRPFKKWIAGLEGSPQSFLFGGTGRNSRPVLLFSEGVDTTTMFFGVVPLGTIVVNGLTIRLKWMADTATSGNALWSAAIERLATDQDSDSFDPTGVTLDTPDPVAGKLVESVITLTAIDALTPGNPYAIQVQRLGSDPSDTMVGTAQLQFVSIESADPMNVPTLAQATLLNDSFGFSTHFDQAADSQLQANQLIPALVRTGAGWIRDDVNWGTGTHTGIETVPGVYNFANLQPFWAIAASQGLKCCAVIGPNPTAYPADKYNQTAMVNFCKALITHMPAGTVLEITNEPNNDYQSFYGAATWKAQLAALTNAVTVGVHSVSPSTQVIGLGAQGSQITTMITTNGGNPDGIVYHPYDLNDNTAEHTFEPPDTIYETWVANLRAVTSKPLWETERNLGGASGEYNAACWNARRMVLSYALGIDHTFLYDFYDQTGVQTTLNNPLFVPMQSYYVVQRVLTQLATMPPTNVHCTVTSPNSAFNSSLSNLKSFVFTGGGRTVAVIWFGNLAPVKIILEDNPILVSVNNVPARTATISFPHGAMTEPIQVFDVVSGELTFRPQSDYGPNGLLMTVTDRPQFITVQ